MDSCFDHKGKLLYKGDDAWDGILDERPMGSCAGQFPTYTTSRMEAGGPIEGSIFKCALKPLSVAITDGTYGSWTPDPGQLDRLQATFPDGVCDYNAPDQGRPQSASAQ